MSMTDDFNQWWDESPVKADNPYTQNTPAYWAWEGWCAGAKAEREVCEALHDHEDVQAPVGNSSWGEAYQEGWGQGTAAYLEAIRARGQV